MMQKKTIAASTMVALAAGLAVAEFVYRSQICRDAIGRFCGRGQLLVLVHGRGIYEADVKREMEADRYAAGQDLNLPIDAGIKRALLARLIAVENVRRASRRERILEIEVEQQLDFFEFEFGDEKSWTKRMQGSGLSKNRLRTWLHDDLRARHWIEHRTLNAAAVGENVCREFYAAHQQAFVQPLRLRARHLFLAAPPETPPEVVMTKQQIIDSLAMRISQGEEFGRLVAQASEDEASKPRGGDLGYISSWRIPPDFFEAISQLQPGETSKPIRSRLGFHIVQVTEIKPPHELTFEEARLEIVNLLTDQHRQNAIAALATQLGGSSALRDGWF